MRTEREIRYRIKTLKQTLEILEAADNHCTGITRIQLEGVIEELERVLDTSAPDSDAQLDAIEKSEAKQ